MKKLLFALLIMPSPLLAQMDVSFSSGIGLYSMSDMKTIQEFFQKQYPVEMKITSAFPPYWFYEASTKMIFDNNIMLGGSVVYGSTGGRISYADYSGKIGASQLLSFYSIAGSIGFRQKYKDGSLFLVGDLKPGMTITDLKLTFDQSVGTQISFDSYKFRSKSLYIQPTISINKRMSYIALQASAGLNMILLHGKLFSQSPRDSYVVVNGHPAHADWSGLRLSLGISLYFKKQG